MATVRIVEVGDSAMPYDYGILKICVVKSVKEMQF
jgi:hypothetical protein